MIFRAKDYGSKEIHRLEVGTYEVASQSAILFAPNWVELSSLSLLLTC